MKLTPAQQQYMRLKQEHTDCLLLFRIGDFYEMFYEDAHIAHRVLDITLTARDKNAENPIPLAGIPFHALERYLPRLIKAGYKVAIAEQIGEVLPGKVVERKVTRVVTAATYIEQGTPGGSLCAISMTNAPDSYHCGIMDVVTGKLHTLSFSHRDALIKYILKHSPSEIVIDIDLPERSALESYLQNLLSLQISVCDVPLQLDACIKHHLQIQSVEGYGKALQEGRERIFGLIVNYLLYTLKQEKLFFTEISYGFPSGILHVDDTTMRNLEVFSSSYEQKSQHSLFALINTCRTAMGSRLLMERLQYPSNDHERILSQHQLIDFFASQDCSLWNNFFDSISDIPKQLSLLRYKGAHPGRLQQLRALGGLVLNSGIVQDTLWKKIPFEYIDRSRHIFGHLMQFLQSSGVSSDQGYIMDGIDDELDRLRQLVFHTDDILLHYQQQLIQLTGISSIRLKYIQNQGYFLEIGKQHQSQFESCARMDDEQWDFSRRSSLKAGERYITSYLENLELRILSAKEELYKREQFLLQQLCDEVLLYQDCFLQWSDLLADYDLACSHYQFAQQHAWVCPIFEKDGFDIHQGRHPLVEYFLGVHEQFIANDLSFEKKDSFHLITGPNMGGKTTYLKQNALILLLAHAGLWVPAKKASIPLLDAIFARIGTGDILAKQQSTFMTEMIEMANILHNATDRSFLVLDEIGRGTSTYDGLALARGICEYLLTKTKAKTLFATHYHELIALEKEYDHFHNYSVSVYETAESVVFLKKIVKGGASKSYGIDVALRAGIPQLVIENAKKHLKGLESQKSGSTIVQQGLFVAPVQEIKKSDIERSLEEIDINSMTPMQALVYVSELKGMLN